MSASPLEMTMEDRTEELEYELREMEAERDRLQAELEEREREIEEAVSALGDIARQVKMPWFQGIADVDGLCSRLTDVLDYAGGLARAIDDVSHTIDELKKL